LENQKEKIQEENEQGKPKEKKKGKVQQVWEMRQKGKTVKDIAKKTGLSERIVRSYIWRAKNPEKYKALMERYYAKKKGSTKRVESLNPKDIVERLWRVKNWPMVQKGVPYLIWRTMKS
jgi:hypothetical protein